MNWLRGGEFIQFSLNYRPSTSGLLLVPGIPRIVEQGGKSNWGGRGGPLPFQACFFFHWRTQIAPESDPSLLYFWPAGERIFYIFGQRSQLLIFKMAESCVVQWFAQDFIQNRYVSLLTRFLTLWNCRFINPGDSLVSEFHHRMPHRCKQTWWIGI